MIEVPVTSLPPLPCPHQQTRTAPTGGNHGRCGPGIIHAPAASTHRAHHAPGNQGETSRGHPQSRWIGLGTGAPFSTDKMSKTGRHSAARTRSSEPRLDRTFRQSQPLVRAITARVRFQAASQSEPRRQEPRHTHKCRASPRAQTVRVRVEIHRDVIFRGSHGVVSAEVLRDKPKCGRNGQFSRFRRVLICRPAVSASRDPS